MSQVFVAQTRARVGWIIGPEAAPVAQLIAVTEAVSIAVGGAERERPLQTSAIKLLQHK
jgi:hypothetical protein